jgi:formylglycine-generating enzyme required for sulfatase activity
MKSKPLIIIGLMLALFYSLQAQAAGGYRGIRIRARDGEVLTPFEQSWAVIIGINDYQRVRKLNFAVNDAKAVGQLLQEKYGFDKDHILTLYNNQATKEGILRVLGDELPYKVRERDRLLIYFAGHGETNLGNGYLIPVDYRQGKYRATAISMTELKDILKDIRAKHIYLVLDACYSGMFFTQRAVVVEKTHPRYLREITKRKARQALTAGGKEPVTDSGYKNHSAFTGTFLEALNTGYADYNGDGIITASEINAYIQPKVAELAEQTPEFGSLPGSEGGEFVFVAADTATDWVSKQRELEAELGRLQAQAKQAETKAKELEARQKAAELAQRIAEARRKKEAAEKRIKELAMAQKPDLTRIDKKSFTNSIGMKFVWIPAGSFMMGGESGDSDEKPVHKVTLSKGFYMQTTEVTQGQWKKVMGNNPSYFKNCGDTCPVESVSWNEVQGFIEKLNQMEGTNKYRLPTEAEWEYACRAGSSSKYSFGNSEGGLGKYAWYDDNSGGKAHPVSQKKPNAWGLYDMHGNVWEWVEDWYGDYPSGAVTDPSGPSGGSYRVFRGGSWNDESWFLPCALRHRYFPEAGYYVRGFRCVRTK